MILKTVNRITNASISDLFVKCFYGVFPIRSVARYGYRNKFYIKSLFTFRTINSGVELDEKSCYAFFFDDWSINYYHWFVDTLPRLLFIAAAKNIITRDISIAIPQNLFEREYIRTSLTSMCKDVFPLKSKHVFRAKQLYIPPSLDDSDDSIYKRRLVYAFLKRRLGNSLKLQTNKPYIYISRSDASYRRILNEASLTAQLSALGFITVIPSRMSLAEQISIFRNAECIAGIHGAGLANIIFTRPKSLLIEIRPSISSNDCFERLCQQTMHNYRCISFACSTSLSMQRDDFYVDESLIICSISSIFDEKQLANS